MQRINEWVSPIINYIANIVPIPVIISGFVVIIAAFYIISEMMYKKKRKTHALAYAKYFETCYNDTHDIYRTLVAVKRNYRQTSAEFQIITNALYYLDNSVLRDYETALFRIEKEFKIPEVRATHEKCLSQVFEEEVHDAENKSSGTERVSEGSIIQ